MRRLRSPRLTTLLVSVGVLFSSMNYYLIVLVLPLYLIHLDHGTADVGGAGVVLGASFFISGLMSPVWGALADRYGPKPMMLRSAIGVTLVNATFPLCHTVTALILVRLANGLLGGFVPAAFSLVSRSASEGNIGKAMSGLSVCRNVGGLLGPALGGLAIAVWGYDAAFFMAASSMALAGLIVLPISNQVHGGGAGVSMASRWRAILPTGIPKPARLPLLLAYGTISATTMLSLGLPLLLSEHDRDGSRVAAEIGALSSASALIALALALVWGTLADRYGYHRLLLAVLPTGAVLVVLIGVSDAFWQIGTVYLVYSAVQCEVGTLLILNLIATGSSEQRGMLMGYNNTAQQFGSATGPVLASLVAQAAGVAGAFWMCGALLAACALVFFASSRSRAKPEIEAESKELV